MSYFRVLEVTSYGGFFGGIAATIIVAPLDGTAPERTLAIEPDALRNVSGDHHMIVPGLALDLTLEGEHVIAATVVGAPDRALLRSTVAASGAPLDAPRVFAHHCDTCGLWILGEPRNGVCALLGHSL